MSIDRTNDNIICFYHEYDEYGCFSNWYRSEFDYAGRHYTSMEQYMMYQKVVMFRQYDLADRIMKETSPAEVKKLGQTRFAEFDSYIWDNTSYAIVKRGVRAKFQQNSDIRSCLLSTGNKLLAEAAPKDLKWGIGVAADDAARLDTCNWQGKNYLGRALMEVRDELRRSPDAAYTETRDLDFPEWHMTAGELLRIPKFHASIHAYMDTVSIRLGNAIAVKHAIDSFLYDGTLADLEFAMNTNMGNGFPAAGFWELKQDIFEIIQYS